MFYTHLSISVKGGDNMSSSLTFSATEVAEEILKMGEKVQEVSFPDGSWTYIVTYVHDRKVIKKVLNVAPV